jgi:uncharacterized SAM-binding protein YcdF (DUF218 family)
MFTIKKIISSFIMPFPLCSILILAAVLLYFRFNRRKAGLILGFSALALLVLLSLSPVSNALIRPLEGRFAAMTEVPDSLNDVQWIVVLGGGHTSDESVSITGQISSPALKRLMEGIRLHKELENSKLILSGSGVYDPVSNAEMMKRIAIFSAVSAERIVLSEGPLDTGQEAKAVAEMLGEGTAIILVTSASHMPRSVKHFESQALIVFPAPTDYHALKPQGKRPLRIPLPSASNLRKSEVALHEYLGTLWHKIGGK